MSGGRFFTLTKKPSSTSLVNSSWICCCISGDSLASFESSSARTCFLLLPFKSTFANSLSIGLETTTLLLPSLSVAMETCSSMVKFYLNFFLIS